MWTTLSGMKYHYFGDRTHHWVGGQNQHTTNDRQDCKQALTCSRFGKKRRTRSSDSVQGLLANMHTCSLSNSNKCLQLSTFVLNNLIENSLKGLITQWSVSFVTLEYWCDWLDNEALFISMWYKRYLSKNDTYAADNLKNKMVLRHHADTVHMICTLDNNQRFLQQLVRVF